MGGGIIGNTFNTFTTGGDWFADTCKALRDYSSLYRSSYDKIAIPSDMFLVRCFDVKRVIFNDPATIVIWKNGDKTVVKCGERDEYDPEKGLAMCFAKHALGDKGSYYNVFKDLLPAKEDPAELELDSEEGEISNPLQEVADK